MAQLQSGKVTFQGNPLTLVGNPVEIGAPAPEFTVLGNDLAPVRLADFRGRVVVIAAVPSLDTPVCDLETRTFNQRASALGPEVAILTISMDLPFAQARWCGAAGIDQVVTLSDHKDASFGLAYGVLIDELRLLARAVFVIDRDGVLRYAQLVPEMTDEPDYDAVIAAVQQVL